MKVFVGADEVFVLLVAVLLVVFVVVVFVVLFVVRVVLVVVLVVLVDELELESRARQLEPAPDHCGRHVAGSQCAKSTSH